MPNCSMGQCVPFRPPPTKEAKTLPGILWCHVTIPLDFDAEESGCHGTIQVKKRGCPNTVT
jgi:hypothetical protein